MLIFNKYQPVLEHLNERNDSSNAIGRLGERLAAALIIFYTASALIISAWSAIIITQGDIASGGPIGMFVHLLKTFGIV
jgi:hypothetical protein